MASVRYGLMFQLTLCVALLAAYQSGADTPILQVDPLQQDVGSAHGTTTFSVSNSGTGTMSWNATVTSGGDWLSISDGNSGTNNGTVTCSFAANTSGESRTGRISVKVDGGGSMTVIVLQVPLGTPVLSVSPFARLVLYFAGSATFAVSNIGTGTLHWSAEVIDGADWLSISNGGSGTNAGTITASATQNNVTAPRTGIIVVTATGAAGSPVTLRVTQNACGSPLTPDAVVATDGEFTDKIRVTWSAAAGAGYYEVFRADSDDIVTAVSLGTTYDTHFDDTTAEASPPENNTGGCHFTAPKRHYYYYWVRAESACGESEYGGPNNGYRASAVSKILERVLPNVVVNQSAAVLTPAFPRGAWGDIALFVAVAVILGILRAQRVKIAKRQDRV